MHKREFFESKVVFLLINSQEGRELLYLLYTKIPKTVKYDNLIYLEKTAKEMNINFSDEQLSKVIYKFIKDCTQ